MFDNVTWTCHICGKRRPDHLISVNTKPSFFIDGVPHGFDNVRYCNDNPECKRKSETFTFMKSK